MRVRVIAVGTKMPDWVQQACSEYGKRLPHELQLQWHELSLGKRARNTPTERAITAENQAMLGRIAADDRVIALDQRGKSWSTEQLAEQVQGWQMDRRDVCLLIGGPDGLGQGCLDRSEQRWSLSPLTLPHPLVRVVLVEQLYRAWSINQGHPYHR